MKYKIIPIETIKNLIEFLDEIQFDAATNQTPEDLHKINFCNWMINELLNGYEGVDTDDKKEKRKNMVDEYFIDWELPEDMSDDEFEKLVTEFDSFLKGCDKEYNKKNPKKKYKKNKKDKPTFRPHIEDIADYMSLDEIKEFLLDDPDLTTEEAFELYYDEHDRVQKDKDKKQFKKSLNKTLKDLGINPHKKK